jgi:hypothetical protein
MNSEHAVVEQYQQPSSYVTQLQPYAVQVMIPHEHIIVIKPTNEELPKELEVASFIEMQIKVTKRFMFAVILPYYALTSVGLFATITMTFICGFLFDDQTKWAYIGAAYIAVGFMYIIFLVLLLFAMLSAPKKQAAKRAGFDSYYVKENLQKLFIAMVVIPVAILLAAVVISIIIIVLVMIFAGADSNSCQCDLNFSDFFEKMLCCFMIDLNPSSALDQAHQCCTPDVYFSVIVILLFCESQERYIFSRPQDEEEETQERIKS